MKKDYRITLQCWRMEPVKVKNGRSTTQVNNYIGGSVRFAQYENDDVAKKAAREMWSENYAGEAKEIKIFNEKGEQVFTSTNLK